MEEGSQESSPLKTDLSFKEEEDLSLGSPRAKHLITETPPELPTPEVNEHFLLKGTEKFLKTTEMISHFILGLKHYSKHNELVLTRMSIDLERRVLNSEFSEYKAAREEIVNQKVKVMEDKFTAMLQAQEEAFNNKFERFTVNQATFEANLNLKLRDLDAALSVRPLETSMREAIRDACKRTAHDVEEPLVKEIKEARRRIEILDGDIFRVKNSCIEGLEGLKDKHQEVIKM